MTACRWGCAAGPQLYSSAKGFWGAPGGAGDSGVYQPAWLGCTSGPARSSARQTPGAEASFADPDTGEKEPSPSPYHPMHQTGKGALRGQGLPAPAPCRHTERWGPPAQCTPSPLPSALALPGSRPHGHSDPREADRGVHLQPVPWGVRFPEAQPAASASPFLCHLPGSCHEAQGAWNLLGRPFPCICSWVVGLSWELLLERPSRRQTAPQAWAPGPSVGRPEPSPPPPLALTTARPSQTHTVECPRPPTLRPAAE